MNAIKHYIQQKGLGKSVNVLSLFDRRKIIMEIQFQNANDLENIEKLSAPIQNVLN
jgi:hypothetical protein